MIDPAIYGRLVDHCLKVIDATTAEEKPFPHIVIRGFFPHDFFQRLLAIYPPVTSFIKANIKHHSNEYGGSTRTRMTLSEDSLCALPDDHRTVWSTVRAAIGCQAVRDSLFSKLASGLCRRFGVDRDRLPDVPAFPRGQFYSETDGYRIAPHPDTRDKIVTMQFAFASDDSQKDLGTEFYTRSLNPFDYLREPRGFIISKTMPFLPNHAYAFCVLNDVTLKSWHGRSTVPPINGVRNSLLHIWYAEPDETDRELVAYQQFLRRVPTIRKAA